MGFVFIETFSKCIKPSARTGCSSSPGLHSPKNTHFQANTVSGAKCFQHKTSVNQIKPNKIYKGAKAGCHTPPARRTRICVPPTHPHTQRPRWAWKKGKTKPKWQTNWSQQFYVLLQFLPFTPPPTPRDPPSVNHPRSILWLPSIP